MGCWNVEDFVTGLPIVGNDKVKFLLLTETTRSKSSRELRSNIFPRCAPLTGLYNEYGTIDNIEKSLNNDFIIQQFKQDYIGNYKIKIIENIMEAISDRELFIDENFFQRNKDQEHLELITSTNKLIGKHCKRSFKDKAYITDLESRIKDNPVSKVKVWPAFVLESIYNKLSNYNFKVNG